MNSESRPNGLNGHAASNGHAVSNGHGASAATRTCALVNGRPWWKSAGIYQIFPASFCDANSDGWGDLPGIYSKLDHLNALGVDAVWISPFYKSPGFDMGYDVSEYQVPDPAYGKLEDVDAIIKRCHELDIKVLFDLVINHTSHEHRWFRESRKSKTNPYRNYYIWRPPRYDASGNRLPPTNWQGIQGGAAWEYSEETDEYYLRYYMAQQPDLNWDNDEVRKAIYQEAVIFWLERGVDGFRVDTSLRYSKHPFVDVEVTSPHEYYQYSRHVMERGPRLQEFLRELHDTCFGPYNAVTIAEIGGKVDVEEILSYVGEKAKIFSMTIRFDLHNLDHGMQYYLCSRKRSHSDFKRVTAEQQELANPQLGGWLCNYLENHDQGRSVSRFGDDSEEYRSDSARLLAMYLTTLSGTLLIYQGQEIGMTNMPKSWPIEEYKDEFSRLHWLRMQALAKNPETGITVKDAFEGLQLLARDHARTPMQWSAAADAGFAQGGKPWMRVMDNHKVINVANDESDTASPLHFWRTMLKLRKKLAETFIFGRFELLNEDESPVMAYRKHSYSDSTSVLVILNFSSTEQRCPVAVSDLKLLVITPDLLPDQQASATWLKAWEGRVYDVEHALS